MLPLPPLPDVIPLMSQSHSRTPQSIVASAEVLLKLQVLWLQALLLSLPWAPALS